MKPSKIWILIATCLATSFRINAADVTMVAFGRHISTPELAAQGNLEVGSCLITVLLINRGKEAVALPTKGLGPDIYINNDEIEIIYDFLPEQLSFKEKTITVVPSVDRFGLVSLRSYEAANITENPLVVEAKKFGSRKIFITFRTEGFMSERVGCSSIRLREKVILLGARETASDIVEKRLEGAGRE